MLEIRPVCEHCGKKLPVDSVEAMICSFECTFCASCVNDILHNVCPNCGGGLEKRPIRPKEKREKYPPQTKELHKPVDMQQFEALLGKHMHVKPHQR